MAHRVRDEPLFPQLPRTFARRWVFQVGHLSGLFQIPAAAPMACFVPVLLIGVLFGLAMDQEVFLVSRMREHFHHQRDARAAVEYGVERGGRVVTVAADNRNSLGPARRGPVTG
jgi:uncharacterized membrane protein YdfJ with MMPL/SSD domain